MRLARITSTCRASSRRRICLRRSKRRNGICWTRNRPSSKPNFKAVMKSSRNDRHRTANETGALDLSTVLLLTMNFREHQRALDCAITAAKAAGRLMRQHSHSVKKITQSTQHDIKLELDVRCQKLIEKILLDGFPRASALGEEGVRGNQQADYRWVVDPIDGTVNFTYGIPHACVSIALQETCAKGQWARVSGSRSGMSMHEARITDYQTLVGVVYDPFCDELWTGILGQRARLNG